MVYYLMSVSQIFVCLFFILSNIQQCFSFVSSVNELRGMSTADLDAEFASGSAPVAVPTGYCSGEVLEAVPSVFKLYKQLQAAIGVNFTMSEVDLQVAGESSEHKVEAARAGILFALNKIWTGNLAHMTRCSSGTRHAAFHTFVTVPMTVAEWSISTIAANYPNTSIPEKDVEGLVFDFGGRLSLDDCHWPVGQVIIDTLLKAQMNGLTVPSHFVDLGRVVGVDDETGDSLLLIKSWFKGW